MAQEVPPRPQPPTESLGNIIGALTQELAKASLTADVMRLKMKNLYAGNVLLKEFEPCKVRIITAKVTLPVAFDCQNSGNAIDPGLSCDQLRLMLSKELPVAVRDRVATSIMTGLGSLNSLADKGLVTNLREIASKITCGDFDPKKHFDAERATEFTKQWIANKATEQEARFLYRAEDLKQQDPNHIVKLDITLDVSY